MDVQVHGLDGRLQEAGQILGVSFRFVADEDVIFARLHVEIFDDQRHHFAQRRRIM